MKRIVVGRTLLFIWLGLGAIFVAFSSAHGHCLPLDPQQQQAVLQQGTPDQNPLGGIDLDLTTDQLQRIREIQRQSKDERFAVNQRLRQAQVALDETLDSDNPSEALIEQRVHDLADAQASSIRMRALNEIKIRQVLTPLQRETLRTLRRQVRDRRMSNPGDQGQRRLVGPRGLPNRRNGIAPLFPQQRKTDLPRKPQ